MSDSEKAVLDLFRSLSDEMQIRLIKFWVMCFDFYFAKCLCNSNSVKE